MFAIVSQSHWETKLEGDTVGEERAWKAFALIPLMILHRPKGVGSVGKQELLERANKFARGQWVELMEGARQSSSSTFLGKPTEGDDELRRRGLNACNRVKQGQVSRSRQELVGAALAPKTLEAEFKTEDHRSRSARFQLRCWPATGRQ